MSGILNKKQRIVDFSLTSNGYKQIQNGDLRFVYATLTDRDAIYDRREGEIDVADLESMPFFFEVYSKNLDVLNSELDLTSTANFNLRTELDGEFIDFRNNEYQNISTVSDISTVFDKISTSFVENLSNQNIVFSTNFLNYNEIIQDNRNISLYISKINNQSFNITDSIQSNDLISIKCRNNLNNYFSICNTRSFDLNKYSMIEDDRFINKINYLFLPPTDLNNNQIMNVDIISKNSKIMNSYNLSVDKRKFSKIIIKSDNFLNQRNIVNNLTNININDIDSSYEKSVINQIKFLKTFDKNTQNYDIISISKFEMMFDQDEAESEFVLNLSELLLDNNNTHFKLNKLFCLNHGELFDEIDQKNYQIYSFGKLLSSKTEIDLDDISTNNFENGKYIIEDNYLFINLFTVIIE